MKKSLLVILGIMVSLMLIATAGCGNATSSASANDVVKQAMDKLSQAKTVHADLDGQMGMSGQTSDPKLAQILPLQLGLSGKLDIDANDSSNPKFHMSDIEFKGVGDLMNKVESGGGSGSSSIDNSLAAGVINQMLSGIEVSMLDGNFYLKFAGSWFKLSSSEIQDATGYDVQCMMSELQSSDNASGSQDLGDVQELAGDTLDGVPVRHFQATADTSKLNDETASDSSGSLEKCKTGKGSLDNPGSSDSEPSTSRTSTSDKSSQPKFNSATMEFWIDSDNNVKKMKIAMKMDDINPPSSSSDTQVKPMSMDISGTISFSNAGQPVDITAPSNAMPFQDLMKEFGGSTSSLF